MRIQAAQPGRKRRGFTLIEVLASVAILAIVVPYAMRAATVASSAASTSRHRAEAATLAEAKLSEIVVEQSWATEGTQGTFAPAFPDYKWSMQSQQRDFNMMEMMLTVTWTERGQERSLNVSTMVYASQTGGVQ